ncbi:histamine N-methyltransferase-like [Hemiscyllium ocellatum]|uniref:histamine N-methyltransferase-like n=1 Tax=Hemiscyllium ocellatum TaxID=170820 RepID=UPI002966D354|nr:histamine N-methyltransferase-like [Hemiscyllium ocellatum]
MESSMKSLSSFHDRYLKSFQLFLERSTEHQCMKKFFDNDLPAIINSIGKRGVSCLNVLGIGSGSGEMDLAILEQIHSRHPGVSIHNEVVEPNAGHISKYKELVKEKGQGLNASFTWNQMYTTDYEKQNKERKESKKFDFIHMIQLLYFVENVHDTIKYFHSLLERNGKLLIIQVADDSGWSSLWTKFGSRFPTSISLDVQNVLAEMKMKYQIYEHSSDFDITECFIEGNENGDCLLDFLTDSADFRKTAPEDLKSEVLQYLHQPSCSREENKKILFCNNLKFIVIDY